MQFRCRSCGAAVSVPDQDVGKKGRCPGCGSIVDIPFPSGSPASPAPAPAASVSPVSELSSDLDALRMAASSATSAVNRRAQAQRSIPERRRSGPVLFGVVVGVGVLAIAVTLGAVYWRDRARSHSSGGTTSQPHDGPNRSKEVPKVPRTDRSKELVGVAPTDDPNGVRFTNCASKTTEAISGALRVYDKFGDCIASQDLKGNLSLRPGQSSVRLILWGFPDIEAIILVSDWSRLTYVFQLKQIIYADGTREIFE